MNDDDSIVSVFQKISDDTLRIAQAGGAVSFVKAAKAAMPAVVHI